MFTWIHGPLNANIGHAFILVYSVCSKQSLEELRPIWNVIRQLKGAEITQIPVMLVGNKCDESTTLREVSEVDGKAEATSWGVSFMETSAKNNVNVTELFQVRETFLLFKHFYLYFGSVYMRPFVVNNISTLLIADDDYYFALN